jgi:hypothetical protein
MSPGHCAGQIALLWRPGRMLFAADVCTNIMGLGDPVGSENLEEGRVSQRNLPVFHSMLPGLGMASLSSTMRRRAFGISTANIRSKCVNCVPRLNAPTEGPVARLCLNSFCHVFPFPHVSSRHDHLALFLASSFAV